MPDDRETYNTFIGLMLSILTIMIIFTYAAYQLSILVSLDQYNVISSVQENHYVANEPLLE